MSKRKNWASEKISFLEALKKGYTITKAAEYAGIPRRSLYDVRDREPEFARAWDDAIEVSNDVLEDEVRKRALDPEAKYSHLLLMFLLKAKRPWFRDNYKTESTVIHENVKEISFSKDEIDQAIQILTDAKTPVGAIKSDPDVPEE